MREDDTNQDSEDPSTQKSLDRLFRRESDKGSTTESNSADIGKYVVRYDQRGRKEEPDQSFEYVVHDEVSLDVDEVESHVRPRKLGELEFEMALLQGHNKEYKS